MAGHYLTHPISAEMARSPFAKDAAAVCAPLIGLVYARNAVSNFVTLCFASPKSMRVLSLKHSGFSTPA